MKKIIKPKVLAVRCPYGGGTGDEEPDFVTLKIANL